MHCLFRSLSGAYGATVLRDAVPDLIYTSTPERGVSGRYRLNSSLHQELNNGDLRSHYIRNLILKNRLPKPTHWKLREALLHVAIQHLGSIPNMYDAAWKNKLCRAVESETEHLAMSGRRFEARCLARSFTTAYFEDRKRFKDSTALDTVSGRSLVKWARLWSGRETVSLDAILLLNESVTHPLPLHRDSFWLAGAESEEAKLERILRYMALCGDFDALKIGLQAVDYLSWNMAAGPQVAPAETILYWDAESTKFDGVLSMAIHSGSWKCLEALVKAGAEWIDCLYWALYWDNPACVSRIMRKHKRKLKGFDSFSRQGVKAKPLHMAAECGLKMLNLLLGEFDEEAAVPCFEDLHWAMDTNKGGDIMDALIRAKLAHGIPGKGTGWEIGLQQWGKLLLSADQKGYRDGIRLVLDMRTTRFVRAPDDALPISGNAIPGPETFETTGGEKMLLYAAWSADETLIRLLLASGIHIETINSLGQTILALAAARGHKDVVELLLNEGADTQAKDDAGKLPWMLASDGKHWEVMEMLRRSDIEERT